MEKDNFYQRFAHSRNSIRWLDDPERPSRQIFAEALIQALTAEEIALSIQREEGKISEKVFQEKVKKIKDYTEEIRDNGSLKDLHNEFRNKEEKRKEN